MTTTTETESPAPQPSAGGKGGGKKKGGWFFRLRRFYREVVAELRKVIWPTRGELLTYTAIVLVFCTVVILIVAGLDYGFVKAAGFLFG